MARRIEPVATRTPAVITAAATRVRLDDKAHVKQSIKKSETWQDESFAYHDEVPEVKHAHLFVANAFSKLRLFAAVRPLDAPADATPIPIDDEESDVPEPIQRAAVAELRRLRSAIGGQAALLARFGLNMEAAGECYLVGFGAREAVGVEGEQGYRPPEPEDWNIRSVSEIGTKGQGSSLVAFVRDKPGASDGRVIERGKDTIIRIWQPHAQWYDQADCPMRALLGECKALQVLSQQVLAETMSHQSAGILLVPNELSFVKEGADSGDGDAADDEESEDPFEEELLAALTDPIGDPSSAASVSPLVVRGEAQYLKELRHLTLARSSTDLDARIEARINRIARGLNLPVEVVLGHMQTTFANAEQVDQDTFEDYLEPKCQLGVDAFSVGFLRPNLGETFTELTVPGPTGTDLLDRICIWYDASDLVAQPNVEENAQEAFRNFAITDVAYRRARGFAEDDAPEPLEILVRAALQRGFFTADLTAALIESLADEAGVDLPEPEDLAGTMTGMRGLVQMLAAQYRTQASAAPAPISVTAARTRPRGRLRSNLGRRLMETDRDLRTRLVVASNDAMTRALERAGARLRSKANGDHRSRLANVPNHLVPATLGRHVALSFVPASDAIEGAWDALEDQFLTWGARAQAQAADVASRVASGFTSAEREALGLRQADDLRTAWTWMRESLDDLAVRRMFDPEVVATLGEFDPTLRVPTGLVRQAIARAGGANSVTPTPGGGAYVALADAGSRPLGGIGTGEAMRDVFRREGIAIEGYEWVYGPAFRARPFEPHLALDGVQFVNFDDEVLANHEGWPETEFFMPGDHDGCICDVAPIIIEPEAADEEG